MNNKNKLKIALADDHPLILEGLRTLMEQMDDALVVGCFPNGESILSYLKTNTVDIVFLDISMPDINGMELCKIIKRQSPETIVLILSNHAERSIIMQSLQNGASGYLLKNASLEELKNCMHNALNNKITFSNEVSEILSRPSSNELKGLPQITKREKQILLLIAEGKTSNQIAQELFLSVLTVDTHRKNLMQKFEVKNAAELINTAVQNHLL